MHSRKIILKWLNDQPSSRMEARPGHCLSCPSHIWKYSFLCSLYSSFNGLIPSKDLTVFHLRTFDPPLLACPVSHQTPYQMALLQEAFSCFLVKIWFLCYLLTYFQDFGVSGNWAGKEFTNNYLDYS